MLAQLLALSSHMVPGQGQSATNLVKDGKASLAFATTRKLQLLSIQSLTHSIPFLSGSAKKTMESKSHCLKVPGMETNTNARNQGKPSKELPARLNCLSRSYFMSAAVSRAADTGAGSFDRTTAMSLRTWLESCSKVAWATFSAKARCFSSWSIASLVSKLLSSVLAEKKIVRPRFNPAFVKQVPGRMKAD